MEVLDLLNLHLGPPLSLRLTMARKHVKPCLLLVLIFSAYVCVSAEPNNRKKSLNIIKQLNRRGPYIGLITVILKEENAFFATGSFRPDPKHPFVDLSGRRFRIGKVHGKKVIYVRCGVGMVNAAAATQQMLDLFAVEGIIHFGIAGNNPQGTVDQDDVAQLDIGKYNVPKGNGTNLFGHIGYRKEQFFSVSGEPNVAQSLVWAKTSPHWLQLASNFGELKLEQCVNSSLCLPRKPKLVVGLRASTANIFVDNAAYRDFLFQTFHISSVDMESAAVVMTSLSNGFPLIVIRGLSDLAGRQQGENAIGVFGSLAAVNTAKAVLEFIAKLPGYAH
ncbi:bark storage protein B-like isoform X2 [Herrania umbratica]|uniref:Bark storage protein B-like isoform X2 n=1 Tax=Herrania umbratica TaxID=108875 RepID=A0A6J1B7G0_9ROSI|nr:bark storage protein B-like isoform X2 [Herrania umbratica]